MTGTAIAGPHGVSPRRLWLYLPFLALLVLALGWTALWFYGRHRIGLELDGFFARQASLGRVWSCPNRTISGYPFRISVGCDRPTFTAEGQGRSALAGTLQGLTLTAQTSGALSMAHVIGRFDGPLVVNEAGLGRTTVTWASALGSFRGLHNRLERASLEVASPEVLLETPGGEPLRLKAAMLEAHVREGVAPADPGTYDVALRLNNADLPPLDGLIGNRDPVNLLLDGKLLKLGAINRRDWRTTVENWRANGGSFKVEQFTLSKGAPRVEARGEIRLDDLKRPAGRLDASFVNAGPILQQFGINLGGGGVGGLLGGLLGGVRQQGETQRDRSLRLPLVMGEGRLSVGPFRVPGVVLRPAY